MGPKKTELSKLRSLKRDEKSQSFPSSLTDLNSTLQLYLDKMNALRRPRNRRRKKKSLKTQKIMLVILTTKMLMVKAKSLKPTVGKSKSFWRIRNTKARMISHGRWS